MTHFLFMTALMSPIIALFFVKKSNLNNIRLRINKFIYTKEAAIDIMKSKKSRILKKKLTVDLGELAASAEFADLFAVSLTSGQSPRKAIETIVDFLPLKFKSAIQNVIRENAFGKPLMIALREMSEQRETRSLKPLIAHIEIAIQRGTPLADVSRTFANEQRAKFKNLLMKQAAAREVAMLFPVVFVVLPSVLAVALYPALTVLQKLG